MIRIGLEVHIHPHTFSKLFCRCPVFEGVCEICMAHPGAKPMTPNKEAILKTIILAKALGCKIEPKVTFLRKHYFYPDLPAGFQRTSTPIGTKGFLSNVRIREIHLEEDAGRYDPKKGIVDYTRAGVPLIEVVTEPDIHSPEHAESFLKKLKDILDSFNIWTDRILRTDINISVDGGKKVEIKEVSTLRGIKKAIEYESELLKLKPSKKIVTKHYDEFKEQTIPAREKESAVEYRYMPDPDIPVLDLSPLIPLADSYVGRILEIKKKMEKDKIPSKVIRTILIHQLTDFYYQLSKELPPTFAAIWISSFLVGEMKKMGIKASDLKIDPKEVAEILKAQKRGNISKLQAVSAIRKALRGERAEVVEAVSDERKIIEIAKGVLKEEEDAVKKYLSGKKTVLHYLIGMVIKKSGGRITHDQAKRAILHLLSKG